MATTKTQRPKPPEIATRALDLLERGYDANASAIASASKAIAGVLPELPAVPFAGRLPEPARVVRTAFAVVDRLVAIQRDYALKLVDAVQPVREKVVHSDNATSA